MVAEPNSSDLLCLIVVFLSFFVMFLVVSDRAKFAAIMTKNGHDQQ